MEDAVDRHDDTARNQDGIPSGALDRTGQDGVAGAGDMLGGPTAGAGGRLGPDDPDLAPTPMPPNQHSRADAEPATDAGENYHGHDDPA